MITRLLLSLATVAGMFVPVEQAFAVLDGTNYLVDCTNCNPAGFSEFVSFDGIAETVNGGSLLVGESETIEPDGAWLEFTFDQVTGGTLAGNINADWIIKALELQFGDIVESPAAHTNNVFERLCL